MKKTFLILFLFLASTGYSQTRWEDSTAAIGKPSHIVSQTYPLPVKMYGMNVTKRYSFTDTVTNVIDTVSRHILSTMNTLLDSLTAYKITVVAFDSTVQLSSSISFPAYNITRIVAGASWNSPERYSATSIPNWYIRKRSTHAGVCEYMIIVEGY